MAPTPDLILIAEGDPPTARRAARALRRAGMAPSVVRDASALEELLARHVPALLLLGALPDGGDPPGLLARVRAAAPEMPVILLLPAGRRLPGRALAPATLYLRRPLEARQLVQAVHSVLDARQAQWELRQAITDIAERARERELLFRTTEAICSTAALPEMLTLLAERMVRELHVTLCQILLLDEGRKHLIVETVFPIRPVEHHRRAGNRIPIGEFECYQRALAGRVVLLDGESPGSASPPRDRDALLGRFRSGLLIPMATTRGIVGLIALLEERSWDRSPFSSQKIHLCQALARQAAIALQNGLLSAERERNHLATLAALAAALDARERETRAHSLRVQAYTLRLADGASLAPVEREALAAGALLHDIGKIGIPDHILLKPGPLSPAEWVEMRAHPTIGAEILRELDHLRGAREIVLAHQERFDGTGYPRGLEGSAIPLGARIFAVADALDAITSDRPYRRGASFPVARAEIARHADTQFDPAVVQAFLAVSLDEWERIRSAIPASPERAAVGQLSAPALFPAACQPQQIAEPFFHLPIPGEIPVRLARGGR